MKYHAYDDNGNLTKNTDARVYLDYTYDALNRNTTKNYSDVTPDLTYTYDSRWICEFQRAFDVHEFERISDYTAYDAMGRMTTGNQGD